MINELAQQGVDACTLNNALNVAQLVALAAVIRLLRREYEAGEDDR